MFFLLIFFIILSILVATINLESAVSTDSFSVSVSKMKSFSKTVWQQRGTRYNLLFTIALSVFVYIIKNRFLNNIGFICLIFMFGYWVGLALIKGLNYSFSDIKNRSVKKCIYTLVIVLVIIIYVAYLLQFLIALYQYSSNVVPIFFKINSFLVASFLVLYKTAVKQHSSLIILGAFITIVLVVFSFTLGCALEESENTTFYQTEIYNKKDVSKTTDSAPFPTHAVLLTTVKGGAALASWSFEKVNSLNNNTLIILLVSCMEYWLFNVLVIGALVSTIRLRNGD